MSFSRSRLVTTALILVNLLLFVPLGLYVAATPFTRMGYDDFCSAIVAQTYGVPGAVQWWYDNLNGRFVAFFINSATTLAGPALQAIYTTALLAIWWAALFSIFRRLLRQQAYPGEQAGILASALILGTLAIVPNIGATLYWHTGTSMYLLALIAHTVYLALLIPWRFSSNRLTSIVCAAVCFIAAGASDTGGLTALIFIAVALALSFWRPEPMRRFRPALIAGLFGTVVAMVFVLAAPGNAVRAALSPPPSLTYALQVIISSPGAPVLVAFHFAPLNTLILMIVPLVAGYFAPVAGTLREKRRARVAIIVSIVGFAVATAAIFGPVAFFLQSGLTEHAWVAPQCLFVQLLMGGCFALGVSFKPRAVNERAPAVVQGLVVVLLAVFALNVTGYALNTAASQRAYAAAWDARDTQIRAQVELGEGTRWSGSFTNPYDTRIQVDANARPLAVASLRSVTPFKWEADADPNTLANRCIARYYGVASVVGVS